ncbi:MAG TPA: ABC transporter permease [Bryobacteraceae bacterium]|jgi:ABC-2 type transport system permease protein|nr:ABC transporter permease [Bryobacteraceae bacterium]
MMERLVNNRVRALMRKEFAQIRRDRRLAISLVLPPTLQLLLLGSALSASVANLKLGAVDDSRTPESRELIAVLSQSESFRLVSYYSSVDQLGDAISRGKADAGVVIPYDFSRNLQRGQPTTVQFLLNAMNANTAAIAQGYAEGVIQSYNAGLQGAGLHAAFQQVAMRDVTRRGRVQMYPAYLYNPGLKDSWFIVTGVFGLLLILNSSLVAAAAMVREREAGTIEQLLMSPASTSEIIIAKIAPLFVLLFLMALLAVMVMKLAFGVPFHGNLPLVLAGAALCILSGISLGTVNATFSKSAQQAQLMVFFINPPLNSTAGALNPVEAMPAWLQPFTVVNPIHHFATIARAALLKGSGFVELWPNFLGLLGFTVVLVSLSIWRFRKQLS